MVNKSIRALIHHINWFECRENILAEKVGVYQSMDELNSSMEEAELSKTLKKLQILETEKDDIVLGFIKEKEIIETIHQEQLEQLKIKHEDEIQAIRQEWLKERENMLRESDSRQVDAENHHEKKSREIEKKLIKKSEGDFKETEEEHRKEKRKLREEYEAVIAQKTSEIEELYRENCILRSKSDPGSFEDKNKESEVMINKLQSKISVLEEDKLAKIMKLKNEFEVEKAELERKQVREKAEFVKKLTSKYDQQNTSNELEKNKSYMAYKQEIEEKIQIVEKLWEERNAEDRKKMNTRLENEIAMQKRRFADELQAKLLERDMTIENLEREKEELSNSVHVERFELAKFYNRELSILNRLDSPTKEDIEVALIDEVAKLRDEQQKVIRNLEKRHKRKMRDLKKSQKPVAEIEELHKNELEEIRCNYEREKEEFEAKLRNEQLNLLKSFEFEKNDIERYFKQLMDEQESEFQDEIQAVQSECEEVKDKLDILEKENKELKNQSVQEKERNGELLDKLQEYESQNARLKEEIERNKRNKREPVKEISVVDNDKEGFKQTVEKLSSLNIQLSDELKKERKRCENLLEKIHELEKEQECLMTRSDADELQSSESGLELSTSLTEKPDRSNRDSYTDTSSVEGKKSGEAKKEQSKKELDMQMKLQDSVQEYLLEIKVLQNAMDEKEMEIKQLRDTFAKEKSELKEEIQHLTDSLKSALDEEDGADEGDLEELKSRYKKLTGFINQVIKDLANKQSSSETSETSHQSSTSKPSSPQKDKGFANEVNALDELLNDEWDSEVKEKLGKKLEELKNNIKRSHELEKLEQQREHEQEKNRYLKELSDERHKELDVSGEVWNAVCEKLGLDEEESQDKLKEILQEKDDPNRGVTSQKMDSERKSKSDDDESSIGKECKVGKSPDFEELKKLKGENESWQRTLKELKTHYEKDKEELMEKLQTQHKEFVLSSEAEVIEKLIKEKSALEEASIVERFNLGRIYYLEMQDELEEILSQRKEDMDKEHEKEKLNIILKFNKDIADLHKLLSDKDDNEVKLLQEKNALAKKVLDVQRRMPGDEEEKDKNNNTSDIKDEAKKLETSLPLKKELADLQRQRQDEHQASIQNLEKALDLIKDLLKDKNKSDDALHRRYSFASASCKSDEILPTDSPTVQSPISVHGSVLSDEEIRNKEDLQKALENLIDDCLSKAKEEAESDTSSGASSDFESEPSSPPPESEEGVLSDSGAESIESECVSIKKADLEMAMNLERFSLGRVYYNEYKDSLKSALKKLSKLKDMNQDLEDKLTGGVKDLVNRTIFGKMIVQSVDMETQTLEVQDPAKMTLDKLSDSHDNDASLEASSEISEKEDVCASSEDEDDEFKNLEKEIMPGSVLKERGKKDAGKQTDELQDHIKTKGQANEENGIEDKENGEPDGMPDTDIKEVSKKDATTQTRMLDTAIKEIGKKDAKTQTDDLQDHINATEEANEGKQIQNRQNAELEDKFPQKEDESPNNEEITEQKKSKDLSPEVSPRENEDKSDEIVEPVCESETSRMLGQDAPENENALKDGYDNKDPKSTAEEEETKSLDSKDKETEKADIEEDQKHEDGIPKDEEKRSTENKENAGREPDATLEHEQPEDAAKVKQSDNSVESQLPKKEERTSAHEDITTGNSEELEVDEQALDDSDIETLKRENDKLKDKFNILKALVGKWFVEEIPELRTADETKQKEGESIPEDIGDKELKELREEEKCLADEIKAIERQISQLKELNDSNNKKEEQKLNSQELLALKQLEKADKALKKEEEKDLIEFLKKEKEEVSKKLEELEMEIEENKDQISDDEKNLFDLMSKKLELEERVTLKARELDKDQKKLAQLQDDAERKKIEEAVHSLAEQKKVLEELSTSPLSTEAQEDSLPLNQQPSEVSDSDTREDEVEPSNLSLKDALISQHVQELVKAKNNEVKKNRRLAKDIEKAERDRDRYNRMTKDREDRLRPFIKKREKLRKNLGERGVIQGITDEREEGEALSTIENKESINTPNETPDEKTEPAIQVEDIEREMMKTRDDLSILGKKAKIPLAMENIINALPSKLKELELERNLIDQQITEKKSTIENLGSEEATELFGLLEAKAELNVKQLDLQEDFPKGYETLPNEVQEAYELSCLEQENKNALAQLDKEIKDEEDNFKEAVRYQRQGKLDDPKSAIAPMLERKQYLAVKLEEISSDLPCGDQAELVNAEAEQSNPQDASERIREIEDLLRQNEKSIKDESLRAAEELGRLIESKQNKTEELLKTADALKEKVKIAELKENALENIPDSILSAIALGRETDEDNQLSFETVERENDIKERCLELQSLKNEGEDTKEKEDQLLNVIEKQTLKEVLPASEKEENRALDPIPASAFAEIKAIKSELENIEEKMEVILNGQSEKENIRPEIDDLSSSFQKKAEIEKNIKNYKEFDDLLKQERKLGEALKTAVSRKELEEIEQIIERKEEEINSLKAKSKEVEEMLEQLNDAKNNNEQNDDKLILEIQEAIKETEDLLLKAREEKESYYENNNMEESNVKEAMSSLEDELEETREEMEFVENELEGLRSISEDDNAISPGLLELTKLLNSQKSLKDYLLEIDRKLDDCDDTAKPSLSNEEIQALKDEKRDAERKFKEIQEDKSKFEVELQDDDIQETYDSLCEEKFKLNQARNDVLHKIHGSNVFVQMAGELEEDKPSEEEQKYYTQALTQMLSDQKTLIKLAEENEKLKDVACRQRELLENLTESISASLGEDLAQAIKLDCNLDEQESLQLPSAILDKINDKEETIADILSELGNENKKLTTLNEDLSNELDHLREKVGETLSNAILQSNSQLLEDKLMPPIDEVISADKTVEEILEERKDALGRLRDVIGENLTDTILKPTMDVRGTDDHQELLKAPKIMSETDEDLQTVIAAYEFELDNLGQGNDILKAMLGNDLVHALLDVDQGRKNKQIPKHDNALAEKGKRPKQDDGGLVDSQSHPKKTSEAKENPNLESEVASNLLLSRKLKPAKKSENVDELSDKQGNEPQDSEGRRLQEPVGSSESEEMCSEISMSSQQPFTKSDVEKYGMTVPALMVKENKTLGEVIKDYENQLDTLKFRLGPELYEEILSAGVTDDDGGDLDAEEREIESQESKKPSDDSDINKEARKDSDDIKGETYLGDEKNLNEEGRKLHHELEGKGQKLPTDIHDINDGDKDAAEEHRKYVDEKSKLDRSATEEKLLPSEVTESKSTQRKSQKPALAAPKKMIEDKQSLADVIRGYENDLETLKTRLGPELFQDILDAGEQYGTPGGSEAKFEKAQQDAYSEGPVDGAFQVRQDSINATRELEDKQENLPSLETGKDDLQRRKAANQPDDLNQAQFARGKKNEFEEIGTILAEDSGTSKVEFEKEEILASVEKQRERKTKKPSLVAPTRMIEENQTLAEVVEGYENDLDILKSRLGPELYDKILDVGKLANTELLSSKKKPASFADNKKPVITGKAEFKPGNAIHESQDNKESESMPFAKGFDSQEKTPMDDTSIPAESGDTGIGSAVSDVKNDLEDEGMNEEQMSELGVHTNKLVPLTRVSEEQADQFRISAPKHMIEENKTLEEVIKGYESDLETLKSKLGPQLFNSLLGSSNLDDEESFDRTDQSNVPTEKQPSTLRLDDSKIEGDSSEELLGKDIDLEHSISEGEAYLSDGELYESFNIPNIKNESTKSEPILDDKLKFNAPSIMAKEGKTLGEVIESYENDLEALKSKLGPRLFEHVLEIAKHGDEQATAGIAKDGYDSKTDSRTKDPYSIESIQPSNTKAAQSIDAEKNNADELEEQAKGKYDEEINERENDIPETEAISLESGERSVTSIDNSDSELLAKETDLVAPKQMLEENKTLEEVLQSYENDLRDFKESLGPQLCDAILNSRKGTQSDSNETTLTLGKEDVDEPEMDYLERTTDEQGKKAANWKAEIDKVILESQPQQAKDNKKDIRETSEASHHGDTQNVQQLQNEEGKDIRDFDKDAKDEQVTEQNLTTQKLEAPVMIAEGKKLDEIICGYENELGALKLRIGPILYKDIVNAGKLQQNCEGKEILDSKKPENTEKVQSPDVILKEKEDENVEEGRTEYKGQDKRPSADIVIQEKIEKETEKRTSAEDSDRNAVGAKDIEAQKTNQEKEKVGAGTENNSSDLQLKTAQEMLVQNKTLEEVVQGYENDLATLNSKLGPELFQSVLETTAQDGSAKAIDKDNAFDDGLSETRTATETGEEIRILEASRVQPESEINEANQGIIGEQVPIVSEVTQEQGEELILGKEDLEVESQTGLSTGSSKDSMDVNGEEKQPSQIKEPLKAPILLAEQGGTLQEIIEKYEKDLDAFNSRLGPNLAKAVVEARGKKSTGKDGENKPMKKAEQDLYQGKKEDTENVNSKEIFSSKDNATHEPVAQDECQSHEKDETKKPKEIEEQQEIDYYTDMLENDLTLEDAVKKLKKEATDLKEKIGPNLSKILLEQHMVKEKEEESRKEKEVVRDSETKDMEMSYSVSEEQMRSSSSEKIKEEILDAEENIPDSAEIQEVKCEDEPKDSITGDDVFRSGSKHKTFMAPKLMEAHNAPLEEVIQEYEHDLSVLKTALGPNLVNLLLNAKATPIADDSMLNLTDAGEDKERVKLTQQDKEETQGLETETTSAKEEDSISEEQRRADGKDKQEKTEQESEQDEMKETKEGCLSQAELQESKELEEILSPLLNGDEEESLEGILRTLHSDLDVLTSKLGRNLSKSLLAMDTDSYNVSKDKDLDDDDGDKDGTEGKQLEFEDDNEAKSKKVEDQEVGKEVKILEAEENSTDDILGTKTAGEEMELDLAAIDQMEENSQTLEEVIKQYENNLERYESSLGPYLSKAILTKEFTSEAAEMSQAQSNLDDKCVDGCVPLDLHDSKNEDEVKISKLDGYLKFLDKGKTLEDLLIEYDTVHEVPPSTYADENGLPITNETEPYSDQIKRLQNQNHDLRQKLDNLNSKIGEGLVNQFQSKEDEDVTNAEELGANLHQQSEGEMDTSEEDVAGVVVQKPILEAPVMMAKENRTLEDVVAEYENDLKEKSNAQDQLEQYIGPHLFKELRELRRQEEEEGEMEERVEIESNEKEKEPANMKPKSKYDVVNKMVEEEKSLATVLGDYENDLEALERENASLRKALEGVSGDGADLGEIISKYENQIKTLENANKEAENNFEDKHNELQNEIDDLRSTLEKLAQTLRQDFLDDLMNQETDNRIEALQIMEKENKTLAEVVEEYEENMKKLEREKAVLQQIAGKGEEGASMLDTVNDYEDAIKGLKEVNKVLNKRIDALSDKIGPQLTKQIMNLCEEGQPSETGGNDLKAKDETETMAAVKEMEDQKITLEEVLRMYDDQNKKKIVLVDNPEQSKVSEKELEGKYAEMDDKKTKTDESVKEKRVKDLEAVNVDETSPAHKQDYTEKEEAAEVIPKALYDKIGPQLIGDIKELDNKTYEELEKEDKRPYALRTMKARNEKLEDVIKAYENTLFNYGLLDTSTLKEESLASELAAIEEDIAVEEVEKYGAQASDHVMTGNKNEEENADSQDNGDSKQIEMLKKELEEEKALKEKYQKDAEDLLNDIVKLKMKNASAEDVDDEEIEKQIKEEYEQKQENKHLREDLSKEKEKNKELQDDNDGLKAEIRNMEKEIKNLEKTIEKMQGSSLGISDGDVDGKIKDLLVKNENLEKELEALKNQLKENEENHKNEKNNLLQQSENEKRDTIKNLLEAKAEVEVKLQEQLALYHELEEKLKQTPEQLDKLTSEDLEKSIYSVNTDETSKEDKDKLVQLKMRNESLKEQLDLSEESMKDALQKYQGAIKSLEIEKAKLEDDQKHEIELLNNKLELEKAALERLKNDYDEMLKKEKERQLEDFEKDLEREKRRSQKDLEEQSEDFERKHNLHKQELQDAREKAEKDKAELRKSLEDQKEKLQKVFNEQMRQKDEEHEKMLNQLREQLEDQMITEKAEMNVQFRHEKTELKTQIEKNIYGDELQKNIDIENDFQESLQKVLRDHANEIEDIEKEMAQAEERFKEQKLKLLEEFENEKLKETKRYEKEKQEMESTIENLLKEIIKLKHQRKEMRQQYREEKQSIEEIAEKERIEIQENMDRSKNELITKLKQDHEKEMESEKEKYEAVIRELQEALERAEAKRKELEEKLRSETLKAEESLNNKSVNQSPSPEVTREVKIIKRGIEMEYEQKLTVEKQRFEDTLQGLRREVGNLQEKRKIIQERVYNQESHSTERHVIEKSIANYKLEVLSKLEGEMAQRIERERKPLEEEVRELQIENEELKRQRWEMKAQFRREKAALEEECEKEKETLEKNLNKEKEELRKRLEAKLQKEKQVKAFDVRVSRSTSPVLGEPSPRIDNTVRMLKQENLSLVSQNAKHEIDIEQLSEKLKFMEMNFKEMMETEKLKAEKMKRIQEQVPKTEVVDPILPTPEYKPSSTGIQDDAILHTLQEKDQQIHQLLETKKYYEAVFGELCDEAGLFELDRNQIV